MRRTPGVQLEDTAFILQPLCPGDGQFRNEESVLSYRRGPRPPSVPSPRVGRPRPPGAAQVSRGSSVLGARLRASDPVAKLHGAEKFSSKMASQAVRVLEEDMATVDVAETDREEGGGNGRFAGHRKVGAFPTLQAVCKVLEVSERQFGSLPLQY